MPVSKEEFKCPQGSATLAYEGSLYCTEPRIHTSYLGYAISVRVPLVFGECHVTQSELLVLQFALQLLGLCNLSDGLIEVVLIHSVPVILDGKQSASTELVHPQLGRNS